MRLKSDIWVKAYVRRCSVDGAHAVVVRHGDDDAGAIFIKINRLDGQASLFGPAPAGFDAGDRERLWITCFPAAFVPEPEVDAYLGREARFDSDLWVIEVEDRSGRNFLEGWLADAQ